MSGPPFRAIGGTIISDHGRIALADALALARFYRREGKWSAGEWSVHCPARADALMTAVNEACDWRRAAGWADPRDAEPARAKDS